VVRYLCAGRAALAISLTILSFAAGFIIASHLQAPSLTTPSNTTTITSSSSPTITALVDSEYFVELKNLLLKANSSVYVIMYVIKYDPNEPDDPVNQLLRVLAELRTRGIDVKVVVDDETYKSYPETITYLKNAGVPTRQDKSQRTTTHAKLVIIDNKTVVIGSHNWTESALRYNHETSVMIQDREIAEELAKYFMNLWNEGRSV